MEEQLNKIRNFSIIAHIDHGKSTLADRLLEITGTIEKRLMRPQYLDQLELERERGITIKMAPVRMKYAPQKNADSAQNIAENEFLYKELTYEIRGAAFGIRKLLGLGHKEGIYHNALAQEFSKRGLRFETEKSISIFYGGKKIGSYQPDFIIENKIIIELKALPEIGRPRIEQLWSYLKGSDYKLALLINFGAKDLEIRRVVYDIARLRDSALGLRQSAQVEEYILNLIDTPGHSDFSYEVSRALAAVEGTVLLVDATQGVQAQTLANFENAKRLGLKIIGVVNKIDIAEPEQVENSAVDLSCLLQAPKEEILRVSGKTGQGAEELLKAVIERIPPPQINAERTQTCAENIQHESVSRALIFDSLYDEHRGVIAFVRVFSTEGGPLPTGQVGVSGGEGSFVAGQTMRLLATNTEFKTKEIGYFTPELKSCEKLTSGEIGYIATGIKDAQKVKIGDTIINADSRRLHTQNLALPGYEQPKPVVFVAFYPEDSNEYENFKQALVRLRLNDNSLFFEPDYSEVLGRGFKCGFLGQLHFEITAERLEREFKIKTVHSFPSVAYKARLRGTTQTDTRKNAEILRDSAFSQRESAWVTISNPKDFPSDNLGVLEPMTRVEIIAPPKFLGAILRLKEIFRFSNFETKTIANKILITAKLPLADLIRDLDDKLKSVSEGFASLSYEVIGYEKADVEKMEILVASQIVPGLTRILPKKDIEREARITVERLKNLLPRQQFVQAVQACVGGRIVARETIPALKKDVTGYLYGGDRSRKTKLWKKQQKGKKKLKEMAGQRPIKIPASIFKELLKK